MLPYALRILCVLALVALMGCETTPKRPATAASKSTAYELEGFDIEAYKITHSAIHETDTDGAVPPDLVRPVPPAYPFAAKRAQLNGIVYYVVVVDEKGVVTDATVYKATHKVFVKPSIDSLRQWKFTPGTVNGVPHKFVVFNVLQYYPQ